MELGIIVAVAISIVVSGIVVFLTNKHTTDCMERMNNLSEKRAQDYFERRESGFLRHFTALFYATDKTNKEGRAILIVT